MKQQNDLRSISDLLSMAIPIMQGLLASGHYTTPETENEPVAIKRVDNGEDWNDEPVHACRHSALVIEDALGLAKELLDQAMLDYQK